MPRLISEDEIYRAAMKIWLKYYNVKNEVNSLSYAQALDEIDVIANMAVNMADRVEESIVKANKGVPQV